MSGHVFSEAAGGSRGATRRRWSAVQRGPGAARKLFAVVVSDVRGDETLASDPITTCRLVCISFVSDDELTCQHSLRVSHVSGCSSHAAAVIPANSRQRRS